MRIVAVGIVIGFLPALCFLWSVFRLLRCLCCNADPCRCHAFGYALCALGQALVAGLVVVAGIMVVAPAMVVVT